MNKDKKWLWALFTFGSFMIMAAPIMGNYPIMITSGLGFCIIAAFFIFKK